MLLLSVSQLRLKAEETYRTLIIPIASFPSHQTWYLTIVLIILRYVTHLLSMLNSGTDATHTEAALSLRRS
jgi:hypothetical protein